MATRQNATRNNGNAGTRVITDLVRFSFVHVFEPASVGDGGEKKYSVTLLIPKKNKALKQRLDKAVEAAKAAGKTDKFGGKIPANLKMPIRDGDEVADERPEYAGCWFVNATSKTKPGVVDEDVNPIMDAEDLYSGSYGRASVNFFAYNSNGSKGIACGLNNVQKLKDGEPLSGRPSAEDDFGDASADIDSADEDDDNEFM